jgi:hypothetical protein
MAAMQKLSVSFSLMATIDKPLVPGMQNWIHGQSLILRFEVPTAALMKVIFGYDAMSAGK